MNFFWSQVDLYGKEETYITFLLVREPIETANGRVMHIQF